MRHLKNKIAAWFTISLTLWGCSHNAVSPDTIKKNTALKGQLPNQELSLILANQYPDRIKALHHVGLTIKGKTYTLKGYLKVNRPEKEIHLIGQGQMGGTLFEIHTRDTEIKISSAPQFFPGHLLKRTVLRDLNRIYLVPEFSHPKHWIDPSGVLHISEQQKKSRDDYLFTEQPGTSGNYQLTGFRQIKNNRVIYAIDYGYSSGQQEGSQGYPDFIKIVDNTLNYELNINISYMGRNRENK